VNKAKYIEIEDGDEINIDDFDIIKEFLGMEVTGKKFAIEYADRIIKIGEIKNDEVVI